MISKYLIAVAVGLVVGQYSMRYAYNPDVLEEVALNFSAHAYYTGCLAAPGMHAPEPLHKHCNIKAQKFFQDNKDIWHNVAWKKY